MKSFKEFSLEGGPVSRHQQIRNFILKKITSGEWKPNTKIPGEQELIASLGVSRMTVYGALRDLRNEGYLVRVQGLGTYVARPKAHMVVAKLNDIVDEIHDQGNIHTADIILSEERRPNKNEVILFARDRQQKIFHTIILHSGNGIPIMLEDRIVNPECAPEFLTHSFESKSSFAYLMELYPYPVGQNIIRAVQPTRRTQKLLKLEVNEPCLEVERITKLNEKVITFVKLIYSSSQYEIKSALTGYNE